MPFTVAFNNLAGVIICPSVNAQKISYLIAAEAELFLNDNASGTSYINEVRRRAAIPGKEAAMKIKPEQTNNKLIFFISITFFS